MTGPKETSWSHQACSRLVPSVRMRTQDAALRARGLAHKYAPREPSSCTGLRAARGIGGTPGPKAHAGPHGRPWGWPPRPQRPRLPRGHLDGDWHHVSVRAKVQQAEGGTVMLLPPVELDAGDAFQDAVVGQVNVPLLEAAGRGGRVGTGAGTWDPRPGCGGPGCPKSRDWPEARVGNTGADGTRRWGEGGSPGVSSRWGLTSSSACRHVPSPRNGATMSSVTGNLSGIRVQRRSSPGLMPLRYWYPKKLSSAQCSATYSGEGGAARASRRGPAPLRDSEAWG